MDQSTSVFSPGLTRRGVSYRHFGLYQPALGALPSGWPTWTPFAVIAALGVGAIYRKIPWMVAGAGMLATWVLLKPTAALAGSLAGNLQLANGTTLPLAADAAFGAGGGSLNMTVNGVPTSFAVLTATQDSTGAWVVTAHDNGTAVPAVTTG